MGACSLLQIYNLTQILSPKPSTSLLHFGFPRSGFFVSTQKSSISHDKTEAPRPVYQSHIQRLHMATVKKQRSKPAAQQPTDPYVRKKKAKSSRNTVNKKTDHKAADASGPNTFCVCPGWDIPEEDLNCDSYGEATAQKGCLRMERGAILISIKDVSIEERTDFIQGQTVFS